MKVKPLYEMFEGHQVLEYKEQINGQNGSKGFRVNHERCGKSFIIYFNFERNNLALKQNGCPCEQSLLMRDIDDAFGLSEDLPWMKAANVASDDADTLKVIVPPSVKPGPDTFRLKPSWSNNLQPPDYVFEYKNLGGDTLFWVVRHDAPDRSKKELHQFFLVDSAEGPRFLYRTNKIKLNATHHGLYGLESWDPARPTLLVEGEKTANRARLLFANYNVLTWCHGKDSFKHCDFSFMQGSAVTIWPDNDKVGVQILEGLANKLGSYGIELKAVFQSPLPMLKEGWDLADEVPAGFNLEEMLTKATPVKTTVKTNAIVQDIDKHVRRIALGTDIKFVDLRVKKHKPQGLFYEVINRFAMNIKYPWMISLPGVKKEVSVVDAWLKNVNTEVLDGITFDPTTTDPIVDNKLNNFIGFPFQAVKPNKEVHAELLKAFRLFCNLIPNREQRTWVFDYAADIFQNPDKKPPTFLTFIGGQGVGKSLIVEVVRHILGDMLYCAITKIDEKNAFNSLESGTLLLYQDEIKISRGQEAVRAYDRLKSAITSPIKSINRKGIAEVQEPSFERRMFTSNHDEPFRIAYDDRRTTIIRINPVHQGNSKAFAPMVAIKSRTDLAEGLMWFLTKRKIKSNLMVGLLNEEKEELVSNENPIPELFFNMLNDCEVPVWFEKMFVDQDRQYFGQKPIHMGNTLVKAYLSDQYGDWAMTKRMAKQLKELLHDDDKERQEGRFKYVDERGINLSGQGSIYTFNTWEKMRRKYDKVFGKRRWKPVMKLQLVVDNTKEERPEREIL